MNKRIFPDGHPHHAQWDLTERDGTELQETYFVAGEPGPGVLFFHQRGP